MIIETNWYAARLLLKKNPEDEDDVFVTKGGPNWERLTIIDLRGWLGICILMGVKKLPCRRHYWMRSEGFIFCTLIARVILLAH